MLLSSYGLAWRPCVEPILGDITVNVKRLYLEEKTTGGRESRLFDSGNRPGRRGRRI
jgi:hypothetical protein